MATLHIPYSLTLVSNLGRDPILNTVKRGFICEFETTLDVDYEDFQNWEVASITFEQTRWNEEFSVDETSDPDLWKLIQRAFEYDWKDLGDKVRECIIDHSADDDDGRGDWERDMQIERMEFGR